VVASLVEERGELDDTVASLRCEWGVRMSYLWRDSRLGAVERKAAIGRRGFPERSGDESLRLAIMDWSSPHLRLWAEHEIAEVKARPD
jgi:hypothetical protein